MDRQVAIQELRRQTYCLIVVAGGEAMPAETRIQSVSDWIELHCAFTLGLRFGEPAHSHEVVRMFVADIGVAGVER